MNFPKIDYERGFEDLNNDSFEKSSSLKGILSLVTGNNIKQPLNYNPLEGFTKLSEVEYYLLKKINTFSDVSKIDDNEIIVGEEEVEEEFIKERGLMKISSWMFTKKW